MVTFPTFRFKISHVPEAVPICRVYEVAPVTAVHEKFVAMPIFVAPFAGIVADVQAGTVIGCASVIKFVTEHPEADPAELEGIILTKY